MSKQYNIRWGRSDYSKLSHLVRKVNKKVFEIEVKRPDIAGYQPAMLDYQSAKAEIKTRRDFNNFIHKYERYLRDGVEEVVKTERGGRLTKFDVNEIKIYDLVENAKKARTRERLGEKDVTIANKKVGFKRKESGTIKENEVKSRTHKVKNMSQDDITHLLRLIDRKMYSSYDIEKKQKMISNYVKGLIAEGYSDELQQMLNKIPLEKFLEIVDTDETATFDFIYDPIELKIKEEYLLDLWKKHVDENVDNKIDFSGLVDEVKNEYANGTRIKGTGRIRIKKQKSRR